METLKTGQVPALVTNIEVMHILEESLESRKSDSNEVDDPKTQVQKRRANQFQHRDFIEDTVYNYLHYTPCSQTNIEKMPELVRILKKSRQKKTKLKKEETAENDEICEPVVTSSSIQQTNPDENEELQEYCEGFGLTDSETLQILNHMPKEVVDIHLLIEDLPNRFSDEQQEELLKVIAKYICQNTANEEGENYDENYEQDGDNEYYDENVQDEAANQ